MIPIPAQTCPEAWLKAATYLETQPKHRQFDVILKIETPFRLTSADRVIVDKVDGFLEAHGEMNVATVRNTIFPADLYREHGNMAMFTLYPRIYKEISRHPDHTWGTYFGRMTMRDGSGKHQGNPLQRMIRKIQDQLKNPGTLQAAYEMGTFDLNSDLPIYDGASDCALTLGAPCLSHLSFKVRGDQLSLAVMYRSHFYVRKALGNLLGLAWLMHYVASECGLKVGPLLCVSTMARLDTDGIKISEIRQLLKDLQAAALVEAT